MDTPIKLTHLAHGGGCGCKIAPGLLRQILADSAPAQLFPDLLVGTETSDDAAVYRINDQQAIVATTDFFMPIVDDAHDFGRIAATNALSDLYAMGATPIMALAIVGMPVDKLPLETIRAILAGGASVCASIGIPVAGGHSIDAPEPIYGLVALGLVHPEQVKRNNRAQGGDDLILSKGIGVGIFSAALKKGQLSADDYQTLISTTTQLNTPGTALAALPGVHAMTDVTGFGLLGHLLEIGRGSGLQATLSYAQVPKLQNALHLLQQGYVTGAATRNWAAYGDQVQLGEHEFDLRSRLLADPQTSGGLLIASDPASSGEVLRILQEQGFAAACRIGRLGAGEGVVVLD